MRTKPPGITLLSPRDWSDYELLDSGGEAKLERFGQYRLVRPEKSALWSRTLPETEWQDADAVFAQGDSGEGQWTMRRPVPERWLMHYRGLAFWARLTPFRHTGVFPEQEPHWDWIRQQIRSAARPVNVLSLFAYTGIASLVAAAADASVTHVDASKPTVAWARENAAASGLADRPIRWLVDDAVKFVRREARRGRRYDGFIMDPPVFGRGPSGEIWRFSRSFPVLLEACQEVMSEQPLFVLVTAYATEERALVLYNLLHDWLAPRGGELTAGELVLPESTSDRLLPVALYSRWSRGEG